MARKPSFIKTADLIFRYVIKSLYEGLSEHPYIRISIFWSIRRSTSHHLRSSHYGSNLSKIDSCELRLCMTHVDLFSALTLLHLWTRSCALWSRAEQSRGKWSAAQWNRMECSRVSVVSEQMIFSAYEFCFFLWTLLNHGKGKKRNTDCQTWV